MPYLGGVSVIFFLSSANPTQMLDVVTPKCFSGIIPLPLYILKLTMEEKRKTAKTCIFVDCLLCAGNFICLFSFTPHNNPIKRLKVSLYKQGMQSSEMCRNLPNVTQLVVERNRIKSMMLPGSTDCVLSISAALLSFTKVNRAAFWNSALTLHPSILETVLYSEI